MSHIYLTKEQKHFRSLARKDLLVHPKLLDLTIQNRPKTFDMKHECPFVYDQGDIGSCTANAICMALLITESDKTFLPSRLWLYYMERLYENQDGEISDSGADAEDGLVILTKKGICPESVWPYVTSNCNVSPPAQTLIEAEKHKVDQIGIVAPSEVTGEALIDAIVKSLLLKIPVLIGIEIYQSFESPTVAKTGIVPIPQPNEQYLGGHEVLIIGYDDERRVFICINSWGDQWGWKGFFNIPYDYITNPRLTSEFICITKV